MKAKKLRGKMSFLSEVKKGSIMKESSSRQIKRRLDIMNNTDVSNVKKKEKQQIQAKAQ